MTWVLTIPRSIPSRNASPRHWAARRDSKEAWAKDLIIAARNANVPRATGKRRLKLTRLMGKGQKRLDEDNHDIKGLIDAMKPEKTRSGRRGSRLVPGASLIVDDSPRYLDLILPVVDERAADGKPGTRIELEDVPE